MKKAMFVVAGLAVSLLAGSPVLAHHGGAGLYDTKATTIKGTIAKFEWINPHNQIYVDVKEANGTVKQWIVATEPPQVMLERGWTRRSLKPGDEVTVLVFAATNGAPVGNVQRIMFADGRELSTGREGATPAPAPAR